MFRDVNQCSLLPALLNLLCHKTGVQVQVEDETFAKRPLLPNSDVRFKF